MREKDSVRKGKKRRGTDYEEDDHGDAKKSFSGKKKGKKSSHWLLLDSQVNFCNVLLRGHRQLLA